MGVVEWRGGAYVRRREGDAPRRLLRLERLEQRALFGVGEREDLRREVAAPVEDREGDGDDDEAERREHDVPVEGGGAGGAR
jgi:hypothetical protein